MDAQPDFPFKKTSTSAPMSCPMKNRRNPDLPPRIKARHLALHPASIEQTFTD